MPPGRWADCEGGIGDAAGDDDVGPGSECCRDSTCADVGVSSQRIEADRCKVFAGVEVQQRLAIAAQLGEVWHEVVAGDVGDLDVAETCFVGLRTDGVSAALGVKSACVAYDFDAAFEAGSEDLLHLLAERRCPARTFPALESLTREDQHRELSEPVAGEDVNRPTLDLLLRCGQPIAEEPTAVRDPYRPLRLTHLFLLRVSSTTPARAPTFVECEVVAGSFAEKPTTTSHSTNGGCRWGRVGGAERGGIVEVMRGSPGFGGRRRMCRG